MKFAKLGESFCYWLTMGEIAFAEKGWLEFQGYKVANEEENDTDLTESHRKPQRLYRFSSRKGRGSLENRN